MKLLRLLGWCLLSLAGAAAGWLSAQQAGAAIGAWIAPVALLASIVRSRRRAAPDEPEARATRYELTRGQALAEAWSRSGVRHLAGLGLVIGLPLAIALGARLADGESPGRILADVKWVHSVLLALLAPALLVLLAQGWDAARALRDRRRSIAWTNRELVVTTGRTGRTLRRDRVKRHAWREHVIVTDDGGYAIAVPLEIARRAGIASETPHAGE